MVEGKEGGEGADRVPIPARLGFPRFDSAGNGTRTTHSRWCDYAYSHSIDMFALVNEGR